MRFLPYILKHLRRNWIRTASTVLAIAISIFFITTLRTVLAAVEIALGATSSSRLVTRHAVSLTFNIPISYKERIAAVPGVQRVAVDTWFGGVVGGAGEGGEAFRNFFNNLAVEAEPFLAMYPEFHMPDEQRRAFLEDMRGCVIGRGLARRFGWDLGEVFQLESFIPPYRKREPFEFVVRAIYDVDKARYPGFDDMTMLFHWKYLREGTGREIGTSMYIVEIDNPSDAGRISRAIDAVFENSDNQTRTETEQAFAAGFVAMAGNLGLLLNLIGAAVTFTILLVTANTMSMAVRERRTEIAVLKTIGFSSAAVMRLVLGEAVAMAIAGGGIGLGLAWAGAQALKQAPLLGPLFGVVPDFGLPLDVAGMAIALTLLLGLSAGLVPAVLAYRARVTEILRQI